MAEHIWTILCGKHLVDPADKIITLVDVVESISQEGLEERLEEALRAGKKGLLFTYPMQLVSWWFRSDPNDKTLKVRFVLLNPSGTPVFEKVATIQWREEISVPARIFVTMAKFPLTMFGLHWFTVEHQKPTKNKPDRWVMVTKIPFSVDKPSNETTSPEQPSEPIPYAPLGSS